jgi:VWFA-related protein
MKFRLLLLLAACAGIASAQTRESVTVNVVDVPVYVSVNNQPVRNLKREDFELFVNGRKQPIDYFDTIALADAAAPPADRRERRLFLMLFDLAFTKPLALDRARRAAVTMIEHAPPSDYFAVATFTPQRGAQFIVPFTNDHVVAARAALALSASKANDPLSLAVSPSERAALVAPVVTIDSRPDDDEFIDQPMILTQEAINIGVTNVHMPEKRLIENQIDSFGAMASRLAPLEGYKHVLVFSTGFRTDLVYSDAYVPDPRLIQSLEKMVQAFHAAGAVIDTIDVGGADREQGANEGLAYYAQQTGGFFIQRENDFKNALTRVSTASASGYRLGFTVPATAKKGENAIDVRIRNLPRGATVSFRRGFSTRPANGKAATDALRIADILQNDIPQSGIAANISAAAGKLRVEIPVLDLVAQFSTRDVDAVMMLYVFDANGTAVTYDAKRLHLTSAARANVTVEEPLSLPAGKYVCKVLLQAGDSIGFTRSELEIREGPPPAS